MCVLSHSVVSNSLQSHGLQPTRLLCLRNFTGKTTVVSCHFLLQGIFPTQISNPGLPHCRQILYYLSHQGNPHSILAYNINLYMYYNTATAHVNIKHLQFSLSESRKKEKNTILNHTATLTEF